MIEVRKLPLSFFVNALDDNHPFGFVRYGDGEFQCLLGIQGRNCDGHEYFPALGAELQQTLIERQDYFYAIGPKASRNATMREQVEAWLIEHAPRVLWYDSETLLSASLMGELRPFVNALRRKRVLLVGPGHLRQLTILNPVAVVETPKQNAYLAKVEIEQAILKRAERADVILFSAGPAAKVMIYDLYPQLKANHTLIDCGSLWDFMVGVDSRRYARRMNEEQKARLLWLNFGIAPAGNAHAVRPKEDI